MSALIRLEIRSVKGSTQRMDAAARIYVAHRASEKRCIRVVGAVGVRGVKTTPTPSLVVIHNSD
jgi:hypothetical protein